MNKFGFLVLFLLVACPVSAAHLTCDPAPLGATHFRMVIDGVETIGLLRPDLTPFIDISKISGSKSGSLSFGRVWILDGISQGVMEWGAEKSFLLSGGAVAGLPAKIKVVK